MQVLEPVTQDRRIDQRGSTRDLLRWIYAWLLTVESRRSRLAYANDLGLRLTRDEHDQDHLQPRPDGIGWLPFLASYDLDPLAAGREHVDAWVERMRGGTPDVPPVTRKTISRRLSSVSSWYSYLVTVDEIDEVQANPVRSVRRPKIDPDYSPTFGPGRDECRALIRAAKTHGHTATVLVSLMLHSGLRTTEAVAVKAEDITVDRGHRVVTIIGKGGGKALVPMAAPTASAVDDLRTDRAARLGVDPDALRGPLLLDRDGKQMTRQAAADLIGRLGRRAKLSRPLTPHGLRHSFITLGLDAGVSLRRMQDSARHKDPRTTRRYDRNRDLLDEHAAYAVAAWLADDT